MSEKSLRGVKRNCLWCDKEIHVPPSYVKLGRGKYCSRECMSKREVYKREPKKIIFVENEKGCFICISHAKDWDGYPLLKRKGKMLRISRFIYQECYGEIPEKMVVRHKCDNPHCINPEHLEIGTYKQNSLDMTSRGRQAKGSRNGASKITEKDVLTIRKMRKEGKTLKEIASIFNLSMTSVFNICKRRNWKHVE